MSRKRGRGSLENYGQMVSRMIRAYGRAFVEVGDITDLPRLGRLAQEVEEATATAVQNLRASGLGFSWVQIAEQLGISPETARSRYAGSETHKKGPVIYGLRLPGDEKIFYVGQTMNLGQRLAQYRMAQGSTNDISNFMRRHGGDFMAVVLEEAEGRDDLDRLEKWWIQNLEDQGEELLNTIHVRRKRTQVNKVRCEATERREVRGRRVPPITVRCSGTPNHAGGHHFRGVEFGTQSPESEWTWTRYQQAQAG